MEYENKLLIDETDSINIHNVGIYFRDLLNDNDNNDHYFNLLLNEHTFQSLTESNKPSNALRKGLYITNVTKENNEEEYKFNLLRCSSNLDGPTDNFRQTDFKIINKVTEASKKYFDKPFNLNHVLAQVYYNDIEKNKKAKIKDHSDKTKDMDKSGIMAFCTFYNNDELHKCGVKSKTDIYDYVYKDISVLTRLKFRLKDCVKDEKLVKNFEIKLYPNSAFVIPLSTNRLYTHEICPSTLDVKHLPTRLGYVIRCSGKEAIHKNNKTYLLDNDNLIELVEPYDEGVARLKDLYLRENLYADPIEYNGFNFSLNKGDYMKPNY